MNSGMTRTLTTPVCSHQSKSTPKLPKQEQRPSDESEPGHTPRDEARPVRQVAEDQPVPERDDESGTEEERPVLERGERDGEVRRVRRILAQGDDAEHEDDSDGDDTHSMIRAAT